LPTICIVEQTAGNDEQRKAIYRQTDGYAWQNNCLVEQTGLKNSLYGSKAI
jgi:hypothetical protein